MTPKMIADARAEALFVSPLSATEPHDAAELREAIRITVRDHGGTRGCAAEMALEFGDHPERAAERMCWAREAAELVGRGEAAS